MLLIHDAVLQGTNANIDLDQLDDAFVPKQDPDTDLSDTCLDNQTAGAPSCADGECPVAGCQGCRVARETWQCILRLQGRETSAGVYR